MTIDSAYDTLKTKDVSLSLWDSVLVRIFVERCPRVSKTLSQIGKNHQQVFFEGIHPYI